MNLSQALTVAAKERKLTDFQQHKLGRVQTVLKKKGRRSRILAEHLAAEYEDQTGKKLGKVETIDWGKILDWLIQNLPTILQLLLSILAVFGL